jgi:phage tail-like protein
MNDLMGDTEYISQAFDATASGVVWYRAKLYAPSGAMAISFYAADSKEVSIMGVRYNLDKAPRKLAAGADFWGTRYDNPVDVLLYGYEGRYLWMKIELLDTGARFDKIRIYYPAHTFARYLPGVYQRQGFDSFFVRFLAIFQSIYLDMDERIAEFSGLLEPGAAKSDSLPILAQWLGSEEFYRLPEQKRGEFLLLCADSYKSYGARTCMERMLVWLCDEKPVIVEYPQMFIEYPEKRFFLEQRRIVRLYGDDKFHFTVIIHRAENRELIPPLLDSMKPAYTRYSLVALRDEIELDGYAYLGVNSYLI